MALTNHVVESFVVCSQALNPPLSIAQTVQTQPVCDFSRAHCIGGLDLLGCKDQEDGFEKVIFAKQALKFFSGLCNAVSVARVHDKDDALNILIVPAPVRSYLVRDRATNVPRVNFNVIVIQCLHVEACAGFDRIFKSLMMVSTV